MTEREFQRQYEALTLPLGMYVLRMIKDIDAAQDVVQESFIRAWQSMHGSEATEIVDFKAYMYRVVRNVAVNYLRQSMDYVEVDKEAEEISEEDVDTSERDARLWRAIDGLPEKCREVLIMSKRDGMKNQEIAEELGISVKTVENQLAKAMKRLRGYNDLWVLMFF